MGCTSMDTERLERAIALGDAGRVEEALQVFVGLTDSTADPGEKASLLGNQSKCLLLLGRNAEARKTLAMAQQIVPKTQAPLYLDFVDATLSTHEGEWGRALSILEHMQREYGDLLRAPEHCELYEHIQIVRGGALVALSRFREARVALEECLKFHLSADEDRRVLSNLGICYEKLGYRDRGKQAFLEALRKGLEGSRAVSAHYHLGTIYHSEKAYAKALMEFEWCLAHIDEGKIPKKHIYQWLASTATTLGMKEDAHRYRSLSESG